MNSKLSVPLIFVGLVLIAAIVLWPPSSEPGGASTSAANPSAEQAVEPAGTSAESGVAEEEARQRLQQDLAVQASDASMSAAGGGEQVAVSIVIDGQAVGYPLAFGWKTGLLAKQTLISDAFGRLQLPAGEAGELQLPEGLQWAQPLDELQSVGGFESGTLQWKADTQLPTLDLKREAGWHGRVLKPGSDAGDVGVELARVRMGQSRERNPEQTDLRTSWQFQGGSSRSNSYRSASTDEAGNFFIDLLDHHDGRMVEISAEVTESPVPGYAQQEWKEEQIPADGWLGALTLDAVETADIAVRVLDPDGKILSNVKVGTQNQSLDQADGDQLYRFQSLSVIDSSVWVRASDFQPASIPLKPPFAQSVYEIHLKPTTRISIEVDMDRFPFSATPEIMIRASDELDFVDVEGKRQSSMRVQVGSLHSTMSGPGKEPGSRLWRGEIRMSKGRVVLTGVRKDLPFEVELVGPLGPMALIDVPPREMDEHLIRIDQWNSGRDLHGKVLNAEGLPVVGASVSLSDSDGHRIRRRTVIDGSFAIEGATLEQFSMDISMTGYVELERRDVSAPVDGNLGNFTLVPARKLRVRFMNPNGTSGPAGMRVNWKNDDASGQGRTQEKGYMVVAGLAPHLPIDLTWEYGGVECDYRINVGEDKVRIPLPAVGGLKVSLADALKSTLDSECYFSLQLQDSPPPTVADPNGFCIGMTSGKTFDAVAVGDYTACMYRLSSSGELPTLVQIGQPRFVRIEAGQTAEVTLRN